MLSWRDHSTEVTVGNVTTRALAYRDQRVCTTRQLAGFYVSGEKNIADNYANNRDRFQEGIHFHKVTGPQLKSLVDLQPDEIGSQISPMTRSLMLWTERGAARHAKMLSTDKAWDIFEELEDKYFRPTPQHSLKSTLGAAVTAILAIGRAVAKVPGVKPAIAMSTALGLIERTTGLPASDMRLALPALPVEEAKRLNATQLGQRFTPPRSAKAVNAALAALQLQTKDAREGWVVTKEGAQYGEALPFTAEHSKHSGYQLLWFEAVIGPLNTYFGSTTGQGR